VTGLHADDPVGISGFLQEVLVIGIRHLKGETTHSMATIAPGGISPLDGFAFYAIKECGWNRGWMVSTILDNVTADQVAAAKAAGHEELINALQFAYARGVEWVRFDYDAPALPGLPIF